MFNAIKTLIVIWHLLGALSALNCNADFQQEGSRLIGAGGTGGSRQGISVALSSDGNTALIGGYYDNTSTGASWVFTRSGGVWSQQGSKLVGTGAIGDSNQGTSVALSSDGNTALIGGSSDDTKTGAAWVFTRIGGIWSQQGSKLVGAGAIGQSYQGISVALSSDGLTALIGGYTDNGGLGASWVFVRSGEIWSPQGTKLNGTGGIGAVAQGRSVALSADGSTALIGGTGDDGGIGASWVFTRSGGVWSQQGSKLVGDGALGASNQGHSVALSSDGTTALIGGFGDDSNIGASWVFVRSGGVWSPQGSKLIASGRIGVSYQGYSVALSLDGNTALIGGMVTVTLSEHRGCLFEAGESGRNGDQNWLGQEGLDFLTKVTRWH